MQTFLIQRLYRQGDTDTSVLLGGRLTLHCRPIRLWKFFRWATWGTHTNGRRFTLQSPWVTIIVSKQQPQPAPEATPMTQPQLLERIQAIDDYLAYDAPGIVVTEANSQVAIVNLSVWSWPQSLPGVSRRKHCSNKHNGNSQKKQHDHFIRIHRQKNYVRV